MTAEAAALHEAACRTPGVTSQLRIMPGGHDWLLWRSAARLGLIDLVP